MIFVSHKDDQYDYYHGYWYNMFKIFRLPKDSQVESIDLRQINWSQLPYNSNSTYLLTQYPEKINWNNISNNTYTNRILDSSYD